MKALLKLLARPDDDDSLWLIVAGIGLFYFWLVLIACVLPLFQ
jgi:hypothetical protein